MHGLSLLAVAVPLENLDFGELGIRSGWDHGAWCPLPAANYMPMASLNGSDPGGIKRWRDKGANREQD